MLTWKFHTGPIYDLAFTPDGRLLTCSSDRFIRLWDVSTRTELRRWECHRETEKVTVSPDGRYFAWGGGQEVVVRRADDGEPIVTGRACWALAFSPNSKRLMAVGSGSAYSAWSLPSGKPLPRLESVEGYNVAFHSNGKLLAAAFITEEDDGRDVSRVRLVTAATGKDVAVLTPSERSKYGGPLAFSPDGRWLASIHAESLVVFDVETRTEIARRVPNRKEMKGLSFSADGKRLLTAGHDELVRVWAAPNWEEVTSFNWKIGRIKSLAVSRDGALAAAGGDRGKVVVWDLD